jgi:hypothetical protein
VLRSERRLDPAIQEELDALDEALRGASGGALGSDGAAASGDSTPGDGDGALAALVADVHASRPELDAGARARLDERAAQSRIVRRGAAATGTARRRRLALALAAVVSVAVPVGGVATQGWLGGESSFETMSADGVHEPLPEALSDSSDSSGGNTVRPESRSGDVPRPAAAPSASGSSASGAASSASPGTGATPDLSQDRRVIRDVRQTVRVAPDGVARAAARVSTVAEDAGGYLASSSVRERGARAGGSFDVVVPVGRLDETVAALGRIGRPVRLSRSSTDVTARAASLQDRLDDERADRAALRLQLARTVDPDRRAARRRELRLRSSRVAALEAQRDELRGRTSTARIALRLTTQAESAAAPATKIDDGRWGLDDAWRDAGRVVEVGAGAALVGAVVLLPLSLLLGGVVVLRRRAAAAGRDRVISGA